MKQIVIIGASHAGITFADQLRSGGFEGSITILEKQVINPVEKPPLSKTFLDEDFSNAKIKFRPEKWFLDKFINLKIGVEAKEILKDGNLVKLSNGEEISYDCLVLASGAKARNLPSQILQNNKQFVLRDFNDALKLQNALTEEKEVMIIGGGYIGLEIASSLRKKGHKIIVLEVAERLLARVASPELSNYFLNLHKEHEVKISFGESINNIKEFDKKISIETSSHKNYIADLIIVGIGVSPEIRLAYEAGLDCDNGIVVDANYRSSYSNIFAIGDCALNKDEYGIRIESVHHAQFSASRVSSCILGLEMPKYEEPWFWSDQYNVKLQSVGIIKDIKNTVSRIGRREGSKSWWSFSSDGLVAVEAVNDPQSYVVAKHILQNKIKVDEKQLSNNNFDLKEMIKK